MTTITVSARTHAVKNGANEKAPVLRQVLREKRGGYVASPLARARR